MRLWAEQIVRATGAEAELVQVRDEQLPPDLSLTGAVSQHLLADATKARRRLGWTHGSATETVELSVSWHLEHPPETADHDFTYDDRALQAADAAA